jgi:hypothetical protein
LLVHTPYVLKYASSAWHCSREALRTEMISNVF